MLPKLCFFIENFHNGHKFIRASLFRGSHY
jgi:hypothetical protein